MNVMAYNDNTCTSFNLVQSTLHAYFGGLDNGQCAQISAYHSQRITCTGTALSIEDFKDNGQCEVMQGTTYDTTSMEVGECAVLNATTSTWGRITYTVPTVNTPNRPPGNTPTPTPTPTPGNGAMGMAVTALASAALASTLF